MDKGIRRKRRPNASEATWTFYLSLLKTKSPLEIEVDPDMPTAAAYWRRRHTHRAFAAAATAAVSERAPDVVARMYLNNRESLLITDQAFDAFLQALVNGSTVAQAAALPGMPSQSSFNARRRSDPEFAAKVDAAWSRRDRIPRRPYDFEAGLQRIRSGEPLHTFHGKGSAPYYGAWARKAKIEPEFAARFEEAKRIGNTAGRLKPGQKERFLEQIAQGRSILSVCRAADMFSAPTVANLRRRDPEFAAKFAASIQTKVGGVVRFADQDYDRVLREITAGRSPFEMTALGLPCYATIRRRAKMNGHFRSRYDSALSVKRRRTPNEGVSALRLGLSQNELWAAANAAVSRGLPPFIRDDVISEMIADVIEGFLEAGDMKVAAREYVSAYYRDTGEHRAQSLDVRLFGDGMATLHDRLAA